MASDPDRGRGRDDRDGGGIDKPLVCGQRLGKDPRGRPILCGNSRPCPDHDR